MCTCIFIERVSPNYSSSFNETDALPARTVFVLDRLTEQVFVNSSSLRDVSPSRYIIDRIQVLASKPVSLLKKILSNHHDSSSRSGDVEHKESI